MSLVTKIGLRNLIKQKRRNILIGIGIAIAMFLLIFTNSFTNGITDILFNKILVNMTGHILIKRIESDESKTRIIRDKEQIIKIIKDNLTGIQKIEEGISAYVRAIGNNKAVNISLSGITVDQDIKNTMSLDQGNLDDFILEKYYNPVIINSTIAEDLNVKLYDIIKTKLTTVTGQIQTDRFTIVGIIETSKNFLTSSSVYIDIHKLKSLLGYKEQETDVLSISLKDISNPTTIIKKANLLHSAFIPEVAGFKAEITMKDKLISTNIFSIDNKDENKDFFRNNYSLVNGNWDDVFSEENGVVLTRENALMLNAQPGDYLYFNYKGKFDNFIQQVTLKVTNILNKNGNLPPDTVFVNKKIFSTIYYPHPPLQPVVIDKESALYKHLLKEWDLLERSKTTSESTKKYQIISVTDWKGAVFDIQTIYEFASVIINIQQVLNLIFVFVVFILILIILIGILNTLRISIRERTREIGTNRAIGMQKGDVIKIFITEVIFLCLFSCICGILFSFIFMGLLGLLKIDLGESPLNIILLNNHLHFMPLVSSIIIYFISIVLMTGIISFIYIKKATRISISQALRFFD